VTNESAVYGNLIQKGDEVLAVADQPVVCLPHQCVSSIIEQTPGVLQLVLRKRPCYSESESRQGRRAAASSDRRSSNAPRRGPRPRLLLSQLPCRPLSRGSCVSDESGVCRGWLLMKKPRSTIICRLNGLGTTACSRITLSTIIRLTIFRPNQHASPDVGELPGAGHHRLQGWLVATTSASPASIRRSLPSLRRRHRQLDTRSPRVAFAVTHSTLTMSSTVETVDDAEFSMMSAASSVSGSTASLPPPAVPRGLSKSGAASSARNSPRWCRDDDPPPPPPPPARHLPVSATSTASSSQSESPPELQARGRQLARAPLLAASANKRESELLRKVMRAKRLEREIQDKKQQLELVSQFLSSPEAASPDSHASQLGINPVH
uniref:PDZ domain-containing protein n=1 Tax=Macrostomum lignano TaxID=282301 RepID=A0A1I8FKH8_9PLAT